MTIHEDHLAALKELEFSYREDVRELEARLKEKQKKCPHLKWTRDNHMFYALGETAPGEQCNECGTQRHVKR